jgi:hypothetical protein
VGALEIATLNKYTASAYLVAMLLECGRTDTAPKDSRDYPVKSVARAEPQATTDKSAVATMKFMLQSEQFELAYKAGFANKVPAIPTGNGNRFSYEGGKVVWLDGIAVLISSGSSSEPYPSATVTMGVLYVKPHGDAFSLVRQFPDAIACSITGNPLEWIISKEISYAPVVISNSSGVSQGVYCASTTLTEKGPSSPKSLTVFRSSYNDSGRGSENELAASLDGKISNTMKNRSFDVLYSRTSRFTHRYIRESSGYCSAPEHTAEKPPEC